MGAEKYTQKTLEALQTAQQTAALHYHQEITSVHLLLALVKEPEGLLATNFEEANTDRAMLRSRLEQLLRACLGSSPEGGLAASWLRP